LFSSKEASFHYAENFLEKRKFELHQVYRALEVIAKEIYMKFQASELILKSFQTEI